MINTNKISKLITIVETMSNNEIKHLLSKLLSKEVFEIQKLQLNQHSKSLLIDYSRGKDTSEVESILTSILMAFERFGDYKSKPVFTMPKQYKSSVLSTKDEINKLISSAKSSIYIFGFWLTNNAKEIVDLLSDAYSRGVKVILIADSVENFVNPFLKLWSSELYPSIYVMKKANIINDDIKMHAKTIIIDEKTILISSANMTYLGLNQNFELGVILESKKTVETICEVLSQIVHDSEYFEKIK